MAPSVPSDPGQQRRQVEARVVLQQAGHALDPPALGEHRLQAGDLGPRRPSAPRARRRWWPPGRRRWPSRGRRGRRRPPSRLPGGRLQGGQGHPGAGGHLGGGRVDGPEVVEPGERQHDLALAAARRRPPARCCRPGGRRRRRGRGRRPARPPPRRCRPAALRGRLAPPASRPVALEARTDRGVGDHVIRGHPAPAARALIRSSGTGREANSLEFTAPAADTPEDGPHSRWTDGNGGWLRCSPWWATGCRSPSRCSPAWARPTPSSSSARPWCAVAPLVVTLVPRERNRLVFWAAAFGGIPALTAHAGLLRRPRLGLLPPADHDGHGLVRGSRPATASWPPAAGLLALCAFLARCWCSARPPTPCPGDTPPFSFWSARRWPAPCGRWPAKRGR